MVVLSCVKKNLRQILIVLSSPGMQGGPLMHIIAAKAQCFYEVQQPELKTMQNKLSKNAKANGKSHLKKKGFRIGCWRNR